MSEYAVSLEQLKFRWPRSDTDILNISQLQIRKQEKLFIYGPSGSGKSTLLNLIAGVFKPAEGSISIHAEKIHSLTQAQRDAFRAEHMGIVFQQFNLLPYLSVIDNVILPCFFSNKRRQKALQGQASLKQAALDILQRLGIGQSSIYDANTARLSVGQQQRVAVARALIGGPELIIADEPTSALDDESQDQFLSLLFELCEQQKSTLLFVSHNRRLETLFDRSVSFSEINQALPAEAV